MNNVVMIGRLTADPELRSLTETTVASFNMAVDRQFSKEKTTDFFKVIVFGKSAENCGKFLAKGRLVGIQGRLQNNNYTTKDGEKRYTTEIIADRVEFLEWGEKKQKDDSIPEGFQALDDDEEDIPF